MIAAILIWLLKFFAVLWVVSPVLLWFSWLIVASLARADMNGMLTRPAKILGVPFYVMAYALDIWVNIFVLTIWMFEIPQEYTVSDRLRRYVRFGTPLRMSFGGWLADNWIDPYYWVPGKKHIRP